MLISIETAVGTTMPDGTIYAGISPETGTPMYATPEDAQITMTWTQAMNYARLLTAHGHQDWRIATKAELNILYQHRRAIGGFNLTGCYEGGYYWSSSDHGRAKAWDQSFDDGYQGLSRKSRKSSLRCVRDEFPAVG